MKHVLPLLLAAALVVPGCGIGRRRRVPEPAAAPVEFVSIKAPTPPAALKPTETPAPTRTPAPDLATLTEECEKIIRDDNLSDVLKHRELFSIALQLEFKGRREEAIVVLREALKYRPENKLTRMKLAQLTGETGTAGARETAGETDAEEKKMKREEAEGPPPGLDIAEEYLDVVNSAELSRCAKGFKLFVLAGKLEGEGKAKEAIFVYRKAVSLCPEEDGPNMTLNRKAMIKIGLLEKKTGAENSTRVEEETGKNGT